MICIFIIIFIIYNRDSRLKSLLEQNTINEKRIKSLQQDIKRKDEYGNELKKQIDELKNKFEEDNNKRVQQENKMKLLQSKYQLSNSATEGYKIKINDLETKV